MEFGALNDENRLGDAGYRIARFRTLSLPSTCAFSRIRDNREIGDEQELLESHMLL